MTRFFQALVAAACLLKGISADCPPHQPDCTGPKFKRLFPPSKDPWYRPPEVLDTRGGILMKVRHQPGNLTGKLKHLKLADQMLFTTRDSQEQPAWAVATVLVPKKTDPLTPTAISYQMSYYSSNVDESPSYRLASVRPGLRYDIIDKMLERGWYVVVPDYQGPYGAFGAGRLAGYIILDACAAFVNLSGGRYAIKTRFIRMAAWGYSAGAYATAWAYVIKTPHGRAVQHYVRTWIMGGIPADQFAVARALDGTAGASTLINAISGIMAESALFNETVHTLAKRSGPFNVTAFERVRTLPYWDSLAEYAHHNVSDYFSVGLTGLMNMLVTNGWTKETALARKMIANVERDKEKSQRMEYLYVYHGIQDEISKIEDIDRLVKKFWCIRYQHVMLRRNRVGGHIANGHAVVDEVLSVMDDDLTKRREIMTPDIKLTRRALLPRQFLPHSGESAFATCEVGDMLIDSTVEDLEEYIDAA